MPSDKTYALDYLYPNGNFNCEMLTNAQENNSFFTGPSCYWRPHLSWGLDTNFSIWMGLLGDRWVDVPGKKRNIVEGAFAVSCGIMRAAVDLFHWAPLWNHFGLYLNDDILPVWKDVDQVAQVMLRLNKLPADIAKRKHYLNIWLFDVRQNILVIKKRADPTCPRYTKGRKKDTFWINHPATDATPSARPTSAAVITLAYGEANRYLFAAECNASRKDDYTLYVNDFAYRIISEFKEE